MKTTVMSLVVFALLSASVRAQSAIERKHPDIVYYADAYADHYHVPRALVHAVITQESGWNRYAIVTLVVNVEFETGHLQSPPTTLGEAFCSGRSAKTLVPRANVRAFWRAVCSAYSKER